MPKKKTNKGAMKRFRVKANAIEHRATGRGHLLRKKNKKLKRHLRCASVVSSHNQKAVRALLGLT